METPQQQIPATNTARLSFELPGNRKPEIAAWLETSTDFCSETLDIHPFAQAKKLQEKGGYDDSLENNTVHGLVRLITLLNHQLGDVRLQAAQYICNLAALLDPSPILQVGSIYSAIYNSTSGS